MMSVLQLITQPIVNGDINLIAVGFYLTIISLIITYIWERSK